MEIFFQYLVVLVLARLFGEVAERLGQSASVGEFLAGIVLALGGLYLASLTPWLAGLPNNAVLGYPPWLWCALTEVKRDTRPISRSYLEPAGHQAVRRLWPA